MNETLDFIQGLVKRIIGLDPAMLIVVFSIALGYVLKWLPNFPNDKIPYVCLGLPTVLYPMLVWTSFEVKKVTGDVILAFIFACVAWGAHKFVLKRLIDDKLFPSSNDGKEEIQAPHT